MRKYFASSIIVLGFGIGSASAATLPSLPTITVPKAPVFTVPAKPVVVAAPKITSAAAFFALVKKH